MANGQTAEAESIIVLRALDELGNETGPEITLTVFCQGGSFSNIWGFGPSQPLVVGTSYVKVSGSNAGTSDYNILLGAPCFTEGTRVRMANGDDVAVEDLAPGMRIWTEDDASCALMHLTISPGPGTGDRAPVAIDKGVFGNQRALRVSPQHCIRVCGAEADLLFGCDRLLVPALHLVGMPGVTRAPVDEVTYYHLIFEGHRVVETEGMLSESFYPGPQALAHLQTGLRADLPAQMPGFAEAPPPPLAPTLKAHEGRMLVDALSRRRWASRQSM